VTAGGGTDPIQSAGSSANCRLAGELLQTGQYEQAAAVLRAAQEHCAQTGDAFMAHVLDAARRLCLACKQCQEETEWHRQAREEAEQRELELKGQLHEILDLAGTGQMMPGVLLKSGSPSGGSLATSELPDPARSESAERAGLWQQFLALIGQKRPRKTTPPASPNASPAAIKPTPPLPLAASGEPSDERRQAVAAPPTVIGPAVPASPGPQQAEQEEQTDPSLAVYCLGPFRAYQDDQPVEDWNSNKGKSIFKYLITHRERPTPKEVLMELFWPDVPPDAARNNLNVAIYGLRQALRQTHPSFSHVLFRDDCYLFNPTLQIWVDCVAFEEHVAAALALQKSDDLEGAIREHHVAEALYQGEFMAEDRYEDWPTFQRQRLQTKCLTSLQHLSRYYLGRGDYATCATMCNKMLAVDPCYEQAHRWLMRCYSRQGQPYLALRQYHLCVERLRADLDAAPTVKTEALYRQIRQGEQV
jgi:DNA-binding SARP family transcriptional activator